MGVFPGPRRVQQYNPLSAPLTPFSGAGIVPSGGGEGVQLYWFPSPVVFQKCREFLVLDAIEGAANAKKAR